MNRFSFSVVIATLMALGGAAHASEPDAKEYKIGSPGETPQVVCRKEKVVGSHFRRRVCRTRTMIVEDRKEAQRLIREDARLIQAEILGGVGQ